MKTIQPRWGSSELTGVTLRLPRDLQKEVKAQAIKAGRSFNTHVVMILMEAAAQKDSAE